MPTFATLQQWLGEQIVPVFFVGFALLMGVAMVYISSKTRRSSLARDRSGRNVDTFAENLAAYGFDPEIARSAYRLLQLRGGVNFPLDPMDDLDRDLGMNDEDVDGAFREVLAETGREYLPGLLTSPLVTVVDVVRYAQASPRRVGVVRRRTA